jgi:hypothetical protein
VIVAEHTSGGAYTSLANLVRRTGITAPQVEPASPAG